MDIQKIEFIYTHKAGFTSNDIKGVCRTKTLPYFSVVQAVRGNYDIQIGSGPQYNTEDRGFFIAPADLPQTIVHHADTSGIMICRWVFLDVRINGVYRLEDLYRFPVILPEQYKSAMNTVFDRLFHAESVFEEYACYAEILHLISMTATDIPLKTAANLEAALNEIKTNHAKKLSVDHLAACCNMSASYFYSVFKKTLDITPLTYLNDYRLLRATALLLTTDLHIAEVAAAVGIEDASYFNRLFHHKYGTTPSAYRKSHRTLFAP